MLHAKLWWSYLGLRRNHSIMYVWHPIYLIWRRCFRGLFHCWCSVLCPNDTFHFTHHPLISSWLVTMSSTFSGFVCINPHCGSRRHSFANKRAYTMHIERSPPFFNSCVNTKRPWMPRGSTRHQTHRRGSGLNNWGNQQNKGNSSAVRACGWRASTSGRQSLFVVPNRFLDRCWQRKWNMGQWEHWSQFW